MRFEDVFNNLEWEEFKSLLVAGKMSLKYVEARGHYILKASDGSFSFHCAIEKLETPSENQLDFETNYLATANAPISTMVSTRFEDENIVLKTMNLSAQADANGDATLEIIVPGSFANIERYIAGGDLYTSDYDFNDKVIGIDIIDVEGIVSPAGTVLQSYVDADVDPANAGWYFEKHHGTEGYLEFEPLGYYGQLRGQLKLLVTLKVKANAYIKGNLWWGVQE